MAIDKYEKPSKSYNRGNSDWGHKNILVPHRKIVGEDQCSQVKAVTYIHSNVLL